MNAKGDKNFEANQADGFRCPCCRQRPPVATFDYDRSRLCINCYYGLRILGLIAVFVLFHVVRVLM